MRTRLLVGSVALSLSALACANSDSGSGGVAARNEWTQLGYDYSSSFTNAAETTISVENVGQLAVEWRFEAVGAVNGAAAVVGDIAYVLSGGALYALDVPNRAVIWQNTRIGGTSSPAYDNGMLFVHTGGADVVGVDAATGTELWRSTTDPHVLAAGYSSAVVFERYVIVGSASVEEAAVAENATFRGGMVAFDRDTGAEIWRYYTVEPPLNGVAVWSTPTIDPATRTVYGSTGNNYTEMAGDTSDSIFALDIDTGALKWLTQLTEGDVFTILNPQSPDTDFGTNPILYETTVDGRRRKLLAAGQKSGVFWALDRETGEVLWSTAVSPGSAYIGGFLNNGAYNGEYILAAGSNGRSDSPGSEEPDRGQRARLVALDPATGAVVWDRQVNRFVWAPVTSANGVGFIAVDTVLQAFDTRTGEKLYSLQTNGTITSAPVIANGKVYVGSGLNYFGPVVQARDFYVLSLPPG